jgi:hypothetical protein
MIVRLTRFVLICFWFRKQVPHCPQCIFHTLSILPNCPSCLDLTTR